MIFRREGIESKLKRLQQWHDFTPYWPRTIWLRNGRSVCAVFETIQRRSKENVWEYRFKR